MNFFLLAKLLKPIILPPTLIAIGILGSFFALKKNPRLGKRILIFIFFIYFILSIEPTAYILSRSLESRYSQISINEIKSSLDSIEGIVILAGGAWQVQNGKYSFVELSGASWRRLWHGVELFNELDGRIPLIYSGSSGKPFYPFKKEADLAKKYALSAGVPEEKFFVESESRTTAESGLAMKNFLEENFGKNENHKIIFITSANHMPRALAVFDKVGITPLAFPADFSFSSFQISPLSFFPSAESFGASVRAIHEYIGLIIYQILGKA